ncbi:hypothetical protein [Clostridium fungisolvens]|uniref:Uncharacterized protein n=1 Tax=Clostridium fungisolvens TaxID=1604897 RepID=A0A6V8SE14_9CLOT|nr:hypothetical protein [Clostridium fungisolvens]GFP75474.1 hypothetical protein bsdtw1_01554 [Clostridium fungisolvens]
MKKSKWALRILCIFIICFAIVQILGFGKLNKIITIKDTKITKIVFSDGRGGLNPPLTVTDPKKIEEFTSYLNKFVIIKPIYTNAKTGWIYSVTLYNDDNKISSITFGNPIIINNDKEYLVLKNNLSINDITKYLKSIDPQWKE